jgi:hypothetical protein
MFARELDYLLPTAKRGSSIHSRWLPLSLDWIRYLSRCDSYAPLHHRSGLIFPKSESRRYMQLFEIVPPKLNKRARLDCGHRGCTSIHLLVAEPAGQYDTEPVMLSAYRQTVKWFCQENDTFLPAFETTTPRGSTSGGRGTDHIIFPSRALIECMPV